MKTNTAETEGTSKIGGATRPPGKHMMALITFICLLPLVYYIPPFVTLYTDNHLWVTVISVGIIVPIISYIMLPALVKLILLFRRRG